MRQLTRKELKMNESMKYSKLYRQFCDDKGCTAQELIDNPRRLYAYIGTDSDLFNMMQKHSGIRVYTFYPTFDSYIDISANLEFNGINYFVL